MLQRSEEPESFIQTINTGQRLLHNRPDFMQEKRISAADRGTAVHAVMQHLPLTAKMDLKEIDELIETLIGKEIISSDEGRAVKGAEIARFFDSHIAERLMNARSIKREVPFTYAKEDGDGDRQIIQGIVDCLFEEQDGWVLLDYKTDRAEGIADLSLEMNQRYGVQLTVYQEAVEAILQIPIKQRLLYLFSADKEVEI